MAIKDQPQDHEPTLSERIKARPAKHPVSLYLDSLAESSRTTMLSVLDTVVWLLTGEKTKDAFAFNWDQVRFHHIESLRSRLQNRYDYTTANKMLSAIRGTMRRAWRLGIIGSDDYFKIKDIENISGESRNVGRMIPTEEISSILNVCNDGSISGVRDATIIALLTLGGLRRAEVCSLDMKDYNQNAMKLRVSGKGNKSREIPVNDELAMAMNKWLLVRGSRAGAMFCAINKGGKMRTNGRLTTQVVYNIVLERAKQASVKNITPHDFRRTFASSLLNAGVDISTVQKLMGHEKIETTQRYDRRGDEAKRDAVYRLPSIAIG